MERTDLLKRPEYWTAKTQIGLFNCASEFMKATNMDRTRLAEHLGVTKGYVSQILNGDYDHRMSKFFELALAFGYIPEINFVPVEKYIKAERKTPSQGKQVTEMAIAPIRIAKMVSSDAPVGVGHEK